MMGQRSARYVIRLPAGPFADDERWLCARRFSVHGARRVFRDVRACGHSRPVAVWHGLRMFLTGFSGPYTDGRLP